MAGSLPGLMLFLEMLQLAGLWADVYICTVVEQRPHTEFPLAAIDISSLHNPTNNNRNNNPASSVRTR